MISPTQPLASLVLRTFIIGSVTLGVFVVAPVVLLRVPPNHEFLSLALPAGAASAVFGWAVIHAIPDCAPSFRLTLRNTLKATAIWSGATGFLFLAWVLMVGSC